MEKSKVKRIVIAAVQWLVLLIAVVAAFVINVWAGVAALLFGGTGFVMGYFCRILKMQKELFDKVLSIDNIQGVLDGQTLVINTDELTGEASIKLVENKKKKSVH